MAYPSKTLDPAQGNEIPSMAELFELHADGVFNFCRRFVGHRVAAEDLTQEVFVRALRYRSTFEGRSSPSTWLYAIASNLCKDYFSQEHRLKLVEDDPLVQLAGYRNDEVEQAMEQYELKGWIRQAIDQLTEGQREVLILSRYHGKTYAEISAITGQSVGAIKASMFRAMARLRTLLGQQGGPA